MSTSNPTMPKLTARDLEFLRLAAEGKTQPEIARQLFISIDAAKMRSRVLREKLGSPTVASAIYKAMRSHLLE